MANAKGKTTSKRRGGGKILPALCNVFGVILLVVVIGLCLPLTVPLIAGYQAFDVVSGSMEPEIPTGSVVYAKETELTDIQADDIIAFYEGENVIVHRVTVNRTSLGKFVTKGDANDIEDLQPVPYAAVIGRVEAHLPYIGTFMSIYASVAGKVYLLMAAACGVMFNILASRMRAARRQDLELEKGKHGKAGNAAGAGGAGADSATAIDGPAAVAAPDAVEATDAAPDTTSTDAEPAKCAKRPVSVVRWVLVMVLAIAFLGSAGVIGYVTWQYGISDATYSDAADKYISKGEVAPIKIDFAALRAENPDVIGWIYCEGTPINYPVLKGKDNDQYLHHDYTGEYNINGSIFIDSENQGNFADSNTIVYGHHMNSGSMFATLVNWADQKYYDEHPVMWLLTPTQDYKIVLFSGHNIDAYSNMYDIIHAPGEQMNSFLATAIADSDFKTNVHPDTNARFVMLTTCAYAWDTARYVLHGQLEPIASAGGVAKEFWRWNPYRVSVQFGVAGRRKGETPQSVGWNSYRVSVPWWGESPAFAPPWDRNPV